MNQRVTRRGISCLFLAATFALGACGGGGGSGTGTVVLGSPVSIQPSVASQSSNQGSVTGGGSTTSGQSVTLTATSNSGFVFVRWTENGNEVSTSSQYTFTASANRQLVAHFMHDVNGIWGGRATAGNVSSSVIMMMHNGDFIYAGSGFYFAGTYTVRESSGSRVMRVQGAKLYQTGAGDESGSFTLTMEPGKSSMAGTFTTTYNVSGQLAFEYDRELHEQTSSLSDLMGSRGILGAAIAGGSASLAPLVDGGNIRANGTFTVTDDDGTACSVDGSFTLPDSRFNLYRVTARLSRQCSTGEGQYTGLGFKLTSSGHEFILATMHNDTYVLDISLYDSSSTSNPSDGFTADVFEPSQLFMNRCAVPRTTPTTIGGETYNWQDIDRPGTLLDEKYWIRSFVNEQYLWYNEVTDVSPRNTDSSLRYFFRMRTFARTESGKAKDKFSGYLYTEDELRGNAGVSLSFGMTVDNLRTSPNSPNNIRVLFTEPGSPAANAGIGRGDKILRIDRMDLSTPLSERQSDIVTDLLTNPSIDAPYVLRIQDRDTLVERIITLTAQEITEAPVHNTQRIVRSDGSAVGYMTLNTFGSFPVEAAQRDAIQQLIDEGGVDDLVLDLRYNGGGIIWFSAQLAYMIAGDWSRNLVFAKDIHNDKQSHRNALFNFRPSGLGATVPEGRALPTLNIGPRTRDGAGTVYILSSVKTCSASEMLINGLRGVNVNVVQIGTTTCGKPYGFSGARNCGVTYYPVMFQSNNAQGFGDFADGFKPANAGGSGVTVPGCHVLGDDVSKDLGDVGEARLKAALNHRANGTCPPVTAAAPPISDAAPNPFPIVIPPGHVEGFRGAILREDF